MSFFAVLLDERDRDEWQPTPSSPVREPESIGKAFERTYRRLGMEPKEVAALMEIDESLLSRMCSEGPGARPLDLKRIEKLGIGFHMEWLQVYAARHGMEIMPTQAHIENAIDEAETVLTKLRGMMRRRQQKTEVPRGLDRRRP